MRSDSRIKPAKWFNNADSPVMLMVDDFTNVWVDLNGNAHVEPEEDWGYGLDSTNSVFAFLTRGLLAAFPRVKTTFFTPVARVPTTRSYKFGAHFGPINENERTSGFFRSVHRNPRFEIAYHGLTHGVPGEKTEDFVQEWVSYQSLQEALETIEKGKKIYFDVFGEYPAGGKYCGYQRNSFSDESIDKSGFLWWCRRWDRGEPGSGEVERFDVRYFGEHRVLDVPSTVFGAMFNEPRGIMRGILGKRATFRSGVKELEHLLRNRLVISIQEHISPARPDGCRQTPNVFDDYKSLEAIFDYLKDKNVWYCTGTELAEYVHCRDNVKVEQNDTGFALRAALVRDIKTKIVTVVIEDKTVKQVVTPAGNAVVRRGGVFNLPVIDGQYLLVR
jgi:hypothetical protein